MSCDFAVRSTSVPCNSSNEYDFFKSDQDFWIIPYNGIFDCLLNLTMNITRTSVYVTGNAIVFVGPLRIEITLKVILNIYYETDERCIRGVGWRRLIVFTCRVFHRRGIQQHVVLFVFENLILFSSSLPLSNFPSTRAHCPRQLFYHPLIITFISSKRRQWGSSITFYSACAIIRGNRFVFCAARTRLLHKTCPLFLIYCLRFSRNLRKTYIRGKKMKKSNVYIMYLKCYLFFTVSSWL